jgi:cytochrome c
MIEERKMDIPLTTSDMEHTKDRVKEALSFYRAVGREISLAEFMNPRGRFIRNDLYIFAIDLDGVMLAHPINERFAGKNFLDVRDSDGRSFIRDIVKNAGSNISGFTDYRWYDPASTEELLKTIYYERTNGMIVCSGFYHSEKHHADSGHKSKEDYPENFFELLEYLGA